MKRLLLLSAVLIAANCGNILAQTKLELQPGDTITTILQRCVGQTVEFRMKSGEKMGGKIEKVGDKLVYLTQLTGTEYFDGIVDVSDVAAVIVRAKSR